MRVLVVDDSGVMRRILVNTLDRAGIKDVVQAPDGAEAIKLLYRETFDVILMDWNMPNMSGIDAVREIRTMGITTPIIMVTSEAERNRVVQAIQAGANNYVVKPFEPDTILAKIEALAAVDA